MSTPEGFDLNSEKAAVAREDEGIVVHITNSKGEPMHFGDGQPVTVTVAGTYSKRYRDAERERVDRRFKGRQPNIETIRRDALEITADCVLAWSGFFDNGKPLDCIRSNVVKVLDGVPWVREQVEKAMEDHAGFSRASSAS